VPAGEMEREFEMSRRLPQPAPAWPADLRTFDPERVYVHAGGSHRGLCAWHLARARAAKQLGMGDKIVLDEIIAGTPSMRSNA